jgi:hypothetical protein
MMDYFSGEASFEGLSNPADKYAWIIPRIEPENKNAKLLLNSVSRCRRVKNCRVRIKSKTTYKVEFKIDDITITKCTQQAFLNKQEERTIICNTK